VKRELNGDHNQCPRCEEYFNSTFAFDKHRVGEYSARRCLTAEEMQSVGMAQNAGGWWVGNPRVNAISSPTVPAQNQSAGSEATPIASEASASDLAMEEK